MFEEHGLAYNPHPEIVPNTMRALRVTELGRERGLQRAGARPADGRVLGRSRGTSAIPRRCVRSAVEAGLDRDEVADVLTGDEYADRVHASTGEARSLGITGIPAFVLDDRLLDPRRAAARGVRARLRAARRLTHLRLVVRMIAPTRPRRHVMDYEALMRQAYDDLNAGDLEGFGAMLDDDMVEHEEAAGLPPNKEGEISSSRCSARRSGPADGRRGHGAG